MSCDECEASVIEQSCGAGADLPPGVESHLASCHRCRVFAASTREVVQWATLPPLDAQEQRELHSLAADTLQTWRQKQARRRWGFRLSGWATAAAIGGALVWVAPSTPLGMNGGGNPLGMNGGNPLGMNGGESSELEPLLAYGSGESLASFDYADSAQGAELDDLTLYEIPWNYEEEMP